MDTQFKRRVKLQYLCSTDTDTNTTLTQIQKYVKSPKCRTQIYILYNYELYELTIKIYVHKYVLDYFLEQKDVFHYWFTRIYFLFL